ncbi:hypothetical protein PCASD_00851 [Puccinia coronata f. sp. avenae]|uniref:Uncharacterized protein n=1 Tax=Puccinia coronata f. sp. avenae TaxID=200324 RepID=A0A2N5VPL3_9BASI|nr:hypothetical protein PCASD_00851 [Puccinia coronata f. sp. avenae]
MSPLATSTLKGPMALLESPAMQPEPWCQDAGLTRTSNHGFLGPQDKDKYTTAQFPEFARVRSPAQSRPGLPLPACPGFDGAGSSTSGRSLPDKGRASVTQRLEKHDNVGSSSEQANNVASLGTLSNRPKFWVGSGGVKRTQCFASSHSRPKSVVYLFLPQAALTTRWPDAPQGVWLTLIRITARPLDGFPTILALQMRVGARTASNAS